MAIGMHRTNGVPLKVGRMQKQTVGSNLIFAFTLAALCATTGCRSMPGYSLFSWGRTPSPESMASAGPAVTYPTPPNANTTPESIASVAGGTAIPELKVDEGEYTTQHFAHSNEVPEYGEQGNNLAAARANGYVASTSEPVTNRLLPSADTEISTTFGDRAIMPKSDTVATVVSDAAMSAVPTGQSNETASFPVGGMNMASVSDHGFAPPVASGAPSPTASGAVSAGFMLPTDSPSFANLEPTSSEMQLPTTGQVAPATQPVYSTANRSDAGDAMTSGSVLPSAESVQSEAATGYTPGSTANALSYPTGESSPTANGSYFR